MLNRYSLGQEIHNIEERISVLENATQTINTETAVINKSLHLTYATPQTILYVDTSNSVVSATLGDLIFPVNDQTTIGQNLDNTINVGTVQDIGTTSIPTFGGIAINGDITVLGTVDGIDVSSLNNTVNNHISNNTTAHFGQDLKSTASPTFNKITLTQYPSLNTDAATKQYVDTHTGRRDWQDSVIEIYNPTSGLPISPADGDRYLSSATAYDWTNNYIYEWNDATASWLETVPNDGFVVFISGGSVESRKFLVYAELTTEWLLIEKSLEHQQIIGTGTYTHSQIDSHINNNTTAHFGQDLKSTANPTFAAVNVVAQPTQTYHLANKSYIDNVIQNINWQKAVISYFDPTTGLPVSPTDGDRYISSATANGWTEDYIYEWDTVQFWMETIPESGYALYVEGGLINPQTSVTYNGTDWVKFGSTLDHTTLRNIGINTHAEIDAHISNSTTAHFEQDLKSTGTPQFAELTLTATTESTDITTGTLKIAGGVGIAKKLSAFTIQLYSTIQSTTETTGSLIVDGGVGIKENVNIGGITKFLSTTNTTSTTTGSVIVNGGMAIQKTLNAEFINVKSTEDAYDLSSGAIHVDGGLSVAKNLHVTTTNSSVVNVLSSANATDTSSGALHVSGGASIVEDLHIGNILYSEFGMIDEMTVVSTLNSTNSSTGALLVNGGVGIKSNTNIGGMLSVIGSSNLKTTMITETNLSTSSDTGALQVIGGTGMIGNLRIYNTTDTSDITTGAVIIDGGVAIKKDVNIGQNLNINGITTAHDINVISTTASIDMTTGALLVAGGVGIDGDTNIGGSLNVMGFTSVPSLSITTLIDSTNTTTGALKVSGGVGIGKNVNIGGELHVTNISTFNDLVSMNSTEESTNISSGAITVKGGVGIMKNINIGGTGKINGDFLIFSTTDAIDTDGGSLFTRGGVAIKKSVYIGGILDVNDVTTLHNQLLVTSAMASTSTTTGALQVSGGVGIGKNLYVGGNLNTSGTLTVGNTTINGTSTIIGETIILATSNSTNTLTGSLQVSGGASFVKDVYIGNSITANSATVDTVHIISTLNSTSTSTGALQIIGGMGMLGSLNVGGTIQTTNSLIGVDATFSSTINSTSSSTGAVKIEGGIGIGKNLNVGIDATISNKLTTLTEDIASTIDATDTTSGALHVFGGVTIDKKLIVNNEIIISTVNATDTMTGALQILGGVAIGQDVFIGGATQVDTMEIKNLANSTSTTTGTLIVNGGTAIQKNLYVGDELHATSSTFDTVRIMSTIIATSSSTGALIVNGGVGISETVYMGTDLSVTNISYLNNVRISSTETSSSITTGALRVAGGIGTNSLYVETTTTMNSSAILNGSLEMGTNDIISVGTITSSENIITTLTETSSSSSTGALRVAGGASLGSLYVDSTITGTTTSVGAIIVNGGIGIGGGINVADTSSFTGIVTVPTQTYRDNSTKVATTAYVDDSILTQNSIMVAPTGFENTTDSIITYNSGTRVFTLSPAYTSFNVWVAGKRFTYSSPLVMPAHADIAGTTYFYYFDDTGTLQVVNSFPAIYNSALVAFLYYYSSTVYLVAEERHGTVMDQATHFELHQNIGTYYVSGLAADDYTLNPSSPDDTHNTFSITSGVISDEQLNSILATTPAGGPYTVLQLTGSNSLWTWTLANTVPFYYQIGSYIQYNQNNAGTWQLTPLTDNTWVNYYVCFAPSLDSSTQTLIIPGQAIYSSLIDAQAESFSNLIIGTLPFPEFLASYKITFHTLSGYTNTGKCRIESWVKISNNRVNIYSSAVSNHQALSGLQLAGPSITYGHVTDQLQLFDGIKKFISTTNSTSTSTGAVVVSGGLGIEKDIYAGQRIIVLSTETSSSTTTGALRIAGGVGINSLYVATTSVLNGNLEMGINDIVSVGTITSSENIITTLTETSSSTSTGALRITGGAGMGSLYVADTTVLNGNLTMGTNDIVSVGTITSSENIITTFTETSSSTSTGALRVAGGAGLGQLYVDTTTVLNGSLTMGTNDIVSVGAITSSENIITTLTETSSSTTTGALRIVGGAGLGQLYVDTTTVLNGSLTMGTNDIISVGTITSSENIITTLTETSSSTTTGALRVVGGAGLGQLYVDTTTVLNGNLTMGTNDIVSVGTITSSENIITTLTEISSSTSTGALRVAGGTGLGSLYVSGLSTLNGASVLNGSLTMGTNDIVSVGTITSSENIITTLTETSSSTTTGALRVIGGAGLGQLYVNSSAIINGTTQSTSSTTGSLIVAGGVGIGKDVYIGGKIDTSGLAYQYSNTKNVVSTGTWWAVFEAPYASWFGPNHLKIFTYGKHATITGSILHHYVERDGNGAMNNSMTRYMWEQKSGDLQMQGWTIGATSNTKYRVYVKSSVTTVGHPNNIYVDSYGANASYILSTPIDCGTGSDPVDPVWSGSQTLVINTNTIDANETREGGTLKLCTTTNSTSSTTGSLVVNGGVGISKDVYIGGLLNVLVTTQSTSTTSGALKVTGGISVGKNIISGGYLEIRGTSQSSPEIYGAVGDGLTDDTVSIQTCITNNRNIIFGKGKIYRINTEINIPSNTTIDLNSSTILTNDGITITTFLNVDGTFISSAISIFNIQSVNNISISNGKLAQCRKGLNADNGDSVFVDNVEIYWTGDAFYSIHSEKNYITNLYLHDNRRTCVNLLDIRESTYSNIKIYNPGVWGIYYNTVNNCIFDNINMDYDTSYSTFYGGATDGVMNVAYLNKYYTVSWVYADGQKTIEHTAYTYTVTNSILRNCNWSMSGNISTKIVNWSNTEFDHCKFGLYWTLPNTNGSGYFESVNMKFIACEIGDVNFHTYTADGAKWDVQFTNCDFIGNIFTNNMNLGTGIFVNCLLVFNDCRFITGNSVWGFGQFDGEVKFNNCDFYPNVATPQYCRSFNFTGTNLQNTLTLMLNYCKFHNSNSSYYPLIFNTDTSLTYSPKIYVDNCVFLNCNNKVINNTLTIVNCVNMNFEDGLNANSNGLFNYYNCVLHDQSIILYPKLDTTNWYQIATGVSLTSGILNLNIRSPTFNEQILDINGSSLIENRNNYSITNSPRILCAGTITSGTRQIDYIQGHARSSVSLITNDEVYQTFIPSGNFYLYNIYTLESTLGSFDYAIYEGTGTGGTLLTSGTSSGGSQIIVPNINIPIFLTSGQTYTLWLKANDVATLRVTNLWYPSVAFYKNNVQQGTNDWALYFDGQTTLSALNVYVKGIINTEVITPNYDTLTYPFIDAGSSTYPTNVTSVYYDSNNMAGEVINDSLFISNTVGTSSTTTGALRVAGGAGINSLYVATTSVLNGNLTMGINDIVSVGTITSSENIITTLTETSSSTTTGALRIAGGAGLGNLYVDGSSVLNGTLNVISASTLGGATVLNGSLTMGTNNIASVGSVTASGNLITTLTETSSSTTTGALRVAGGAGIGSLYISGTSTHGGATVLNGSLTMGTNDIVSVGTITSSENIIINNTETSSSTTTGALRVYGGAGIDSLFVNAITTLNSSTYMNGNLSMGINDISSIGDITSSGIISSTSTIKTTDPSLSTSTSTGALQVAGGAGLGSLYVENNATIVGTLTVGDISIDTLNLFGTVDSTSSSTGTMIVSGGAGIAKNLYVGNGINAYNSNNLMRTNFSNKILGTRAVSTWTTRASAADNNWYGICWSPQNGIFCATATTGTGNRVMTSSDGINWTTRASAADNQWYSVSWSPELGLFCAVSASGAGNRVMTSSDGIIWTTRTSAADNNWWSVCWSAELGIFCAVAVSGTGNRVMTSPDGITWTTKASATDNNWYGVTWSPELSLFCAIASSGTGNRVMTSPTGETWTTRASAADINWSGVCWSSELSLFCSVAATGTGNRVMTSPDGITWTTRASAATNAWLGISWSPELGLFCAVSSDGTGNRVMTSPDGIVWTTRASAADNFWKKICWSSELGLFCTVADGSGTGNRVMTSKQVFDNKSRQYVDGIVTYASTLDSTSTSTGAFKIVGGVGIAKNINIGGYLSSDNMRSIESFGAVGDGITNDTTAINSALASGKNILFGYQKNYYCSGSLLTPPTHSIIIDFNGSTITNDSSQILHIDGQTSGLTYIIKNGELVQLSGINSCLGIGNCEGNIYFSNMRFIGAVAGVDYRATTITNQQKNGGYTYFDNCYISTSIIGFRDIDNGAEQCELTQFTNCIFDCDAPDVGAISTEGTTSKHHIISDCVFKCDSTAQYALYVYMPDLRCENVIFNWNNITDQNCCKCCGTITGANYSFVNCYFETGLWATCPNTIKTDADVLTSNVYVSNSDLKSCRMSAYNTITPQNVNMIVDNCKTDRFLGVDLYAYYPFTRESTFEIKNSKFNNYLSVSNTGSIYTGSVNIHNNTLSGISANGSLYLFNFVDGIINVKDNIFDAPADASMPNLIVSKHRETIAGPLPAGFKMNIDNNLITDNSRILHGLSSHWGKTVDNIVISNNKGSGKLYYCYTNTTASAVSNSWAFGNITKHTNNNQSEIIAWIGTNTQMRGYNNINVIDGSNDPVNISHMKITVTTLSTSTSTGALQVAGGAGLGSLYVANNATIVGTLTVGDISIDTLNLFGTIESTSTSTGALIVSGGAGVAENLYVGGLLNVSGDISSGYSSTSQSFTGPCTLTATLTCYKIGHLTLIQFPLTTNTVTSATYFSGTGIVPAIFRPLANVRKMIFVTDNNVEISGSITITSSGDIFIYTGSNGNFTLSGIAGFSLDLEYIN